MKVSDAILSRRSMRVFKPDPVPEEKIRRIIEVSKRAASNVNLQPWRLYVTMGEARKRLSAAVLASLEAGESPGPEYSVYKRPIPEPYRSRQVAVGKALYGMLNIPKGDAEGMARQHKRNYVFFDAPVGLIMTVDRAHGHGQWLDCGAFLANLMLMAREEGLHSCPQAAFANHHPAIRRELNIPDNEIVICGLAIGHADENEVPNNLITERAPLEDFVAWHRA